MSVKISPKMPDCSTRQWDCPASRCESCHPKNIDPETNREQREVNTEESSNDGEKQKGQICAIKIHKAWKNIKVRTKGQKDSVIKVKHIPEPSCCILCSLENFWSIERNSQAMKEVKFLSAKYLLTLRIDFLVFQKISWRIFFFCVHKFNKVYRIFQSCCASRVQRWFLLRLMTILFSSSFEIGWKILCKQMPRGERLGNWVEDSLEWWKILFV